MIARLGRRLLAAASVAATVLALLVLPPASTARADDMTQCIAGWAKAAMDPAEIAEALKFVASYGECIPLAANPSGQFAAIVAALVAAKQAGAFSSIEGCQSLIPELLGEVVLKVGDSVGDVIGFKVPQSVKNEGKDALVKWASNQAKSNPVVGSIMAQMDCGCAIATFGSDKIEKIVKDLAETVEACAGLIGDVAAVAVEIANKVKEALEDAAEDLEKIGQAALDLLEDCLSAAGGQKSVLDCLEEFPNVAKALVGLIGGAAEAAVGAFLDALEGFGRFAKAACCSTIGKLWGGACGGCSPPPKPTAPKVDLNCQGVLCAAGLQCGGELNDRCVPCGDVSHAAADKIPGSFVAHGKSPGMCGCNEGYEAVYQSTAGGPVLLACSCAAPMVEKQQFMTIMQCACPIQGQVVQYKGGKQVCECKWGERLRGGKCQPIICPPGQEVASNGKSCTTDPISLKDQPPGGGAPLKPWSSKCPQNAFWDGKDCSDVPPPSKTKQPFVARCPTGTVWNGIECLPPSGPKATIQIQKKPSPKPQTPETASPRPRIPPPCPPNTMWNGRACAPVPAIQRGPAAIKEVPFVPRCQPGTRWDGARCVPVTSPPSMMEPRPLRQLPPVKQPRPMRQQQPAVVR